jgi:hypothetical protein
VIVLVVAHNAARQKNIHIVDFVFVVVIVVVVVVVVVVR